VDQTQHAQLWQAIGTTVRTAVIGYLLAMLIGSVLGAIVSRIPPLRAATGSIISGLQTMPSIAWFPFAIILFAPRSRHLVRDGARRGPVDRQRPDHRRRLHAAAAVAGGPDNGPARRVAVPAPDPAGIAACLPRRTEAGLGVRVAQLDGWPVLVIIVGTCP